MTRAFITSSPTWSAGTVAGVVDLDAEDAGFNLQGMAFAGSRHSLYIVDYVPPAVGRQAGDAGYSSVLHVVARGGGVGKIAFWITTAAVLFAGDVPLSVFKTIANSMQVSRAGFAGQLLSVVLIRPGPSRCCNGVFYLWTTLRVDPSRWKSKDRPA